VLATQPVREATRNLRRFVACGLLRLPRMASRIEPWTIPLHVIMWATLLGGLIMTLVVVMMN
jgi:hypothetical protein